MSVDPSKSQEQKNMKTIRAWSASGDSPLPAVALTGSTSSSLALTPAEERDVLNFDPWGERDATYRVLRASFVKVRREHQCAVCFGPVVAGSRVWARTEVDDGKCMTFRFCAECCWCIAHRYDESEDDGNFGFDRMYGRWDIGRSRADSVTAEGR